MTTQELIQTKVEEIASGMILTTDYEYSNVGLWTFRDADTLSTIATFRFSFSASERRPGWTISCIETGDRVNQEQGIHRMLDLISGIAYASA